MKLTKAFAKRLREILKARNLTQYQLFKLSGVAQSTISSVLRAECESIKLSTAYELLSGLGIEFSEFFNVDYLKFENIDD